MNYYAVERSTSLTHHGILGQKWGVRRYQNYDGTLKAAGKKRYGTTATVSAETYKKLEELSKTRDHKTEDKIVNKSTARLAINVARSALTLNPFAMYDAGQQLVGAGVSAARTKKVEKALSENTNVDPKTGFKLKNKEMSEKEDLKMVNPGFRNLQDNSKNNCMLCTVTYDLRRRGYDATAKKASVGYNHFDLKRWYPNVEHKAVNVEYSAMEALTHKSLIQNTTKALLDQGDGARGNLMVGWANSFAGHSMAYEVSGGKVRILDGQANKVYENPGKILKHARSATYARLDNLEPNWEEVKECARS